MSYLPQSLPGRSHPSGRALIVTAGLHVPGYPIKYANWIAIGWIVAGIVLTVFLSITRPERLRDMGRVYVEDETLSPADAAAQFPVA